MYIAVSFSILSWLCHSFHANSVGDPTLEVELEQGREAKKVLESVVANLRTGDCVLRLQSKKLLKHNMALTNSYMTNLRGQHSLQLETTTPFKGSGNISSSFITNFQGTQELCVKGLHRIGERNVLTMSYITDLSEGNQVSMEAKHSVKGSMETALKVTNDLHGALQLCVSSSHIRDCNRWGLTYRCAFCSPILCHFVIQEVFVMNLINCQFGPDYLLDHNACTGIVMAKSIL
jgi:hypothetical protein